MSEWTSGLSASVERRHKKHIVIGLGLMLCLLMAIVFSVGIGRADLTPAVVTRVMVSKVTGMSDLASDIPAHYQAIVWDVRVPRILSAVLIGAVCCLRRNFSVYTEKSLSGSLYHRRFDRGGFWRIHSHIHEHNTRKVFAGDPFCPCWCFF